MCLSINQSLIKFIFARVPILDGLSIITSQTMQSKMTEAYMNEFNFIGEIMIYSYLQSFNRLHHFTDGFEISGLNRAKATYKICWR